jgi:peptidoglycan/xylan/chitin deacetylase (PgdA/CDA1 family)
MTVDAIVSQTPIILPTATETPKPTVTPDPTLTPTPNITPPPQWIYHEAGKVTIPILLYHHIAEIEPGNRYYVSPRAFAEQMAWLWSNGYTTIPISTVVQAIMTGADLPEKPVVITFDDGDEDVFTNAFPIMDAYGFKGTIYLIAGRMNGRDVISNESVLQLINAGWEIGSHSYTHIDLSKNHDALPYEVVSSRDVLQQTFQVPVNTFAYPFGAIDPSVVNAVANNRYLGAVGLGILSNHDLSTLYYLSRLEVQSDYDLEKFSNLLPWR